MILIFTELEVFNSYDQLLIRRSVDDRDKGSQFCILLFHIIFTSHPKFANFF